MAKYNAENERVKRKYLGWVGEAKQCSVATVDAIAKALSRFEGYNRYKSFRVFRDEQAVGFKKHLLSQASERSGERLSKSTVRATLAHLSRFFFWLADQPGYKSRLQHSDSEYFSLSKKDERIASAHTPRQVPTLEQVKLAIQLMRHQTEIELRNRAVMAFILLTGARDSAVASMKLRHIDLVRGFVFQDARDVKTKFSKTITTFFFPVGPEIIEIVRDWVRFLVEEKHWGNDDPLFPATKVALGESRQFEPCGLHQKHWSNTQAIRRIFREAFEAARLPYFSPHSLRSTLAQFGLARCGSPEGLKALSQNLGHEQVLTTLMNYGRVAEDRQGEIIRGLTVRSADTRDEKDIYADAVVKRLLASGVQLIPAQSSPPETAEGER